jgi:hypothetical protein
VTGKDKAPQMTTWPKIELDKQTREALAGSLED